VCGTPQRSHAPYNTRSLPQLPIPFSPVPTSPLLLRIRSTPIVVLLRIVLYGLFVLLLTGLSPSFSRSFLPSAPIGLEGSEAHSIPLLFTRHPLGLGMVLTGMGGCFGIGDWFRLVWRPSNHLCFFSHVRWFRLFAVWGGWDWCRLDGYWIWPIYHKVVSRWIVIMVGCTNWCIMWVVTWVVMRLCYLAFSGLVGVYSCHVLGSFVPPFNTHSSQSPSTLASQYSQFNPPPYPSPSSYSRHGMPVSRSNSDLVLVVMVWSASPSWISLA